MPSGSLTCPACDNYPDTATHEFGCGSAFHRGKIWQGRDGVWRYICRRCDYGAGSNSPGGIAVPWLIALASRHATAR